MKKRLVSFLLVFAMVFSMFPTTALAAPESKTTTAGSANPFTDVKEKDWYYDAVQYARVNGFFNGTTATTFDPSGTMTRGMFVTVLGRMAGVDTAEYAGQSTFTDVPADMYYAPYVAWAVKHGITNGTGEGKFSPDALINRQQMAAFFVRYFEAFGVNYDTGANIATTPADMDRVSDYAKDAVLKLWKQGLLNGDGTSFNPQDNATRAQTATLCMRTDEAVETWYKEPGVASDRVSIDPTVSGSVTPVTPSKPSKPSGGSSGGGSSSGGSTTTTYYEVRFAMGAGQDSSGVTMPETKTYPKDTKISLLPTPHKEGGLFMGWYYDAAMTQAVGNDDVLTKNTTLYAKMGEVTAVSEQETPNYITVVVPVNKIDDYDFGISGYTEDAVEYFSHVSNLNALFTTDNDNEDYRYTVTGETVSAPWKQGQTYSIKLKDSSAALLVVDGVEQPAAIRVLNIITEKGEVQNLQVDGENMKFLPKAQVKNMSETLAGLFSVALREENGQTTIEKTEDTGSFDYDGDGIMVGDIVAIYEGTRPDERELDTANESVVYVEITSISGNTYSYRTAETEDVLFTPDVLPVPEDADKDKIAGQITVDLNVMDFSDNQYQELGLSAETTVDEGDFIAFYSGTYGAARAPAPTYGKIESVTKTETQYIITYTDASVDDVLAAMDIYDSRNEEVELTDEQIASMEAEMAEQAIESGFLDEAAEYLTALALETDGFQELSDDLDMDLSSYSITFADGTPVDPDSMDLMAVKAEITEKSVEPKIMAGTLVHFEDGTGLRAELVMTFKVEIENHKGNKLEITMQAIFEQEILLTINVSGGAVWKWAWIIPYIYDYNMNANLDIGTYTGIAVTATAKTAGKEEEDEGYDWKPVSGNKFEEKVVSIGKQITDLMDQKEEFMGKFTVPTVNEEGEEVESSGTITNGGLAEKYAAMMEDAEESWIEIVRVEIFASEGHVDPFHILCYGISADFVVSANLYVTLGMTFEFGVAKRYNFSMMLFHRKVSTETIDLEEAHYQFDFYVMGTIGVRAGVEFEIAMGLFSLKLDSIGITAEAGAYAQLWGYFYYHLSWSESGGKDTSYSGAMAIEIGLYLTVTFKAQLFSMEKLTYQPTLYENNWPLLTIGELENVYDFWYPEDPAEIEDNPEFQAIVEDILNLKAETVKTIPVPSELFYMNYMDMTTGDIYGSDSEDGDDDDEDPDNPEPGDYDDETESHFEIEFTNLSNPNVFRYNAESNQIIVYPSTKWSTEESGQMVITWKDAPLAFTSRALQRTVNINWTNTLGIMSISFDSNGADKAVANIVALEEAPITWPADPTRVGYDFVGWQLFDWATAEYGEMYEDRPTNMPKYEDGTLEKEMQGIVLKAVWEPHTNIKYSVELYQEQPGTTEYALVKTLTYTDGTSGTTRHLVRADENYNNNVLAKANGTMAALPNGDVLYLDLENSEIEKTIAPDGSTVFKLYYKLGNATVKFTRGGYGDKSFAVDPTVDTITYTAKAGSKLYVPNMVQPGYELIGFEPDSNDLSIPAGGLLTVPGYDVTYTAEWKPSDNTPYEIHYYGDDGYGNYLPLHIEQKKGTTDTEAKITETDWLTLEGYTAEKTSDKNITTGNISADGNTVLKLHYSINKHTVSFDLTGKKLTGGIGVPDSLTSEVVPGSTITAWEPASTGYVFMGWYTKNGTTDTNGDRVVDDADWGEVYDFDTPVTAPITLYAKWEEAGQQLTVRHHVMNADGETYEVYTAYAQKDKNDLILKTGVTVELANLVDDQYATTGFAYNAAKSAVGETLASTYTIPAADLAEIHLYYDRETYRFEDWDIDGVNDVPGVVTKNPQDYTPGEVAGSIFYHYGMSMIAPELECTGYTFKGWDPAFTGTMPAQSVRYTAVWEANTDTAYKVEFWLEDADGNYIKDAEEALTGTTGAAVELAPYASKYADLNGGFKVNATETGAESWTIAPDGSLVVKIYYERETKTLTFMVDDEVYDTITQKWGTDIVENSLPADPEKEGAEFYGWTPIYTKMPQTDATVEAEWTVKTYNLVWNLNGGSDSNPSGQTTTGYLPYGTTIVAPQPVKTGYDFVGWNVTIPEKLTSDLSATAQWTPWTTTVNFHANIPNGAALTQLTGSMAPMTATYDGQNSYTNAFALPNTGFTPMNWNTKADGSGTTYPLDGTISNSVITKGGTIDLYMQWSAAPVDYTIALCVQTVSGDTPTESNPTYTFTRTAGVGTMLTLNEAFLAADSEIAAKIPFEHFYVHNPTSYRLSNSEDQTITLFVLRETYTVTFDANGGTWDDGTSEVKTLSGLYGAAFTAPVPSMEAKAYTWSPALDETVFVGNEDYTAQWTDAKYTVKWMVDGEIVEIDRNVAHGSTPRFDGETPTKDADAQYTYTLVWNDGTNTYAPGKLPAVTGDVIYTAEFVGTIRTYTVTWDPMNGEDVISDEYAYGTQAPMPDDPTNGAYTFAGWLDTISGTLIADTYNYQHVTVYGNMNFEAQWNEPSGEYYLWIGETRVSSDNASDVFGNGKVRYSAGTNTLYLTDYKYEGAFSQQKVDIYYVCGHILYTGTKALNIVVSGENTLNVTADTTTGFAYPAINVYDQKLNITGSGTLNMNTEDLGIVADSVVMEDVTLNITSTATGGVYGINADLTVNSGKLTCTPGDNARKGQAFWAYTCILNGGSVTVPEDTYSSLVINGGEYHQAYVGDCTKITLGEDMAARVKAGYDDYCAWPVTPTGYVPVSSSGYIYITGGQQLVENGAFGFDDFYACPADEMEKDDYYLWIGSVPVTSENASNVVITYDKDSTASYDIETNTLTYFAYAPEYAYFTCGEKGRVLCAVAYAGDKPLTIRLSKYGNGNYVISDEYIVSVFGAEINVVPLETEAAAD